MPDLIGLLVARDITGSGSPGACFLSLPVVPGSATGHLLSRRRRHGK